MSTHNICFYGEIFLNYHQIPTISVHYEIHFLWISFITNEPVHDKSNKMACAPSDDSDQPGHPPSLIRVFPGHSMGS